MEDSESNKLPKQGECTTVSSKTLFHFIPKLPFLKTALKEGLWPRYNVESNWDGISFAIPMLSFCDIPLSMVKEHIRKYGHYGIGVTKSFVRDQKLTPAIYLTNESHLMNKIRTNLRTFDGATITQRDISIEEQLLYYVKKVNGKEGETKGNYKYYDEREWRYIPEIDSCVHLEIVDKSYDDEKLEELSNRTLNKKIKLLANDISYIIVDNDSEISDIVNILERDEKYSKHLHKLCSRIITVQQIKDDF